MYLSYFGLDEKPFAITPDPRFLYLSERYREALAHLLYGAGEGGGFVQLTGEVGTGKTTICRAFFAQVPDEVDVALVLNPKLSAPELLRSVYEELRIPLPQAADSTKALVDGLSRYLLDAHTRGRRTVLLIDEAQNLSVEVLEQVRLLTNLETEREKLLQIFLVGQPELRELLARPQLRQVAQRITARYHLLPLSVDETRAYVQHRLQVAGLQRPVMSRAALRAIYRHSGGIPRLINIIADRALLGAYARDRRTVSAAVVRRAAAELLDARPRPRALPAAALLSLALATALGIGQLPAVSGALASQLERWLPPGAGTATPLAAAAAPPPSPMPDPPSAPATVRDAAEAAGVTAVPAYVRLQALLRDEEASRDREAAERRLLALWGVHDETQDGLCEAASAQGLRCRGGSGGWRELQAIDRPALLSLGDGETELYAVLTAMDADGVTVAVGGGEHIFAFTELDTFWRGGYRFLWRPPSPEVVLIGDRSPAWAVRWVGERLGLEGDRALSDYRALRPRVEAFQRERGLQVDGLAGPRTLMALNALTDATVPRLARAGSETRPDGGT